MANIGYARVSTDDQNLSLQLDQLNQAECLKIFKDTATGSTAARPELKKCLKALQPGDTLIVWKLDRLSRSSLDFLRLIDDLHSRDIFFKSLTQPFDTSTPEGRMMMNMVATFAEYERELIRERTKAGLESAKQRGVKLGRPTKLTRHQKIVAKARLDAGERAASIARDMNVSPQTIGRINMVASPL